MMLTEQERQRRKSYIGASDMAAVLGLSPWRSAYDLWLEKTGRVDLDSNNRATQRGTRLEPAILDYAAEAYGALDRNVWCPAGDGSPLAATMDAVVRADGTPVEAKSDRRSPNPYDPDGWGEDGSDSVPQLYLVQCAVQMYCSKKDLCHVSAFLGDMDFHLFELLRSDSLTDMIVTRAYEFYTKNVKADTPPDSLPSLEVAKAIRRQPVTVEGADELIVEFLKAKEAEKAAKGAVEFATQNIMARLGTAEELATPNMGRLSYREQSRKEYTVAASTYRVLRHIKAKKGD